MVAQDVLSAIIQYTSEIPNAIKRKIRNTRKEKTGNKQTRKATSPFPIHPVRVFFLPDRHQRNQMPAPIPQTVSNRKFPSILSAKTTVSSSIRQIVHWIPPKIKRVDTPTCRSRKSERISISSGHNKRISIAFNLW